MTNNTPAPPVPSLTNKAPSNKTMKSDSKVDFPPVFKGGTQSEGRLSQESLGRGKKVTQHFLPLGENRP